jgi:predicted transcriptional regulator
MTLSDEARERLADIVERQPTKNGELQELWGMDSGSEVHQYLESELKEYYYRNDNSLICATPEATALIDGEDSERVQTITVTPLQQAIVDVIAGPDEESQSVVAVLHALRDIGEDPEVDDVRSGLRSLADKGIVETIQKTVPTFRLAVERDNLEIELAES